jgi:very-short-patch-repair endonuclease
MDRWKLDELVALAAEQHAAFTVEQAAGLGITRPALARLRRDRVIDRVRAGVHAVLALVDQWTPMAALQLACPRSVAARRAAGILLGYDGYDALALDALVPFDSGIRGPTISRVRDLVVPEIVVVDGLRCTDEIRTLCDSAPVLSAVDLERAVESWRRRPGRDVDALRERAEALARRGKSGPQQLLRVLDLLPSTPTESDLETVYWQALREHGVELPQRQVWVGRYRLDFAYADIKLFVELDGYWCRNNPVSFRDDRHRQNDLVRQDWAPLRFTDSDVRRFARRTAMQTAAEVRRRRARWAA